jgi:hypothetical protein
MAKNKSEDYDEPLDNTFYIPNNFTDSGRIFQGMFEIRNVFEAIGVSAVLGFLLFNTIQMKNEGTKLLIVIGIVAPIGIASLIGYQGDSLSRTIKRLFLFLRNRKKMRYRRIRSNAEKTAENRSRQKATNKRSTKAKSSSTRTR